MSTPALLRLREAKPDAHITLLTHEKLKDLWQGHPAIDAVKIFKEGEGAWSIGARLRSQGFDIALVFPNSPRSVLEVWLGRIPQRIGYARPWRNWLLTQAVPARSGAVSMHKRSVGEINRLNRQGTPASPPLSAAHHIHQYLHLAAALGARAEPLAPKLAVSDAAVLEFVAKFKLSAGTTEATPWFGLNAGAEYGPAKRWPEQRFLDAAIEIERRTKCRWLVFGLKSEREAAERISANISRAAKRQFGGEGPIGSLSAVNLAGMTSLGELCAALKFCRVLLTNDSGPMHVAAALGRTVVVPFGSTSPELTGPGLPGDDQHQLLRANVPCAPCFLRECPIDFRCMTGISVESVVEAVVKAPR